MSNLKMPSALSKLPAYRIHLEHVFLAQIQRPELMANGKDESPVMGPQLWSCVTKASVGVSASPGSLVSMTKGHGTARAAALRQFLAAMPGRVRTSARLEQLRGAAACGVGRICSLSGAHSAVTQRRAVRDA